MKILIACEYSGRVRDAFIAKGHAAISCDILPSDSSGPHYQGDVRDLLDNQHGYDLLIAHPPCTRLTNAGVRWLSEPPKGKTKVQIWKEFFEAVEFYEALRDAQIEMKAIENPIMHCHAKEMLGDIKRQIVQPWYFGEKAFKATGFELHGLPNLEDTDRLDPPKPGTEEHKKWSFIHRASPGPDRWKLRSTTFQGIADAMATQWG